MKLITHDLMNALLKKAADSSRRRSNHNFHDSPSDPVQRYLIGTKLPSYFRPHRHEARWEFALVIQGAFEFVVFDDIGRILHKIRMGGHANAMGCEIQPNTWHTWVPLEDNSVFLELKPGPYDANTASTFANWSPKEDDPQAVQFLAKLKESKVGDKVS